MEEAPLTGLALLKAKRARLLSETRRRAALERHRERSALALVAMVRAGELRISNTPTAQMRHDRSFNLMNLPVTSGGKIYLRRVS